MRAVGSSIVAVLLASACGAGDDDPVVPVGHFAHDVIVGTTSVTVWMRDVDDPPCEPEERFPHPGECARYTDYASCSRPFDACSWRVSLERHGVVLAEAAPQPPHMQAWLPAELSDTGAELVIERCDRTR